MSTQQTLGEVGRARDSTDWSTITADEFISRAKRDPDPRTSREFRCDDCGSRCTVGTDGQTEYGHRRTCSYKGGDDGD